MVSFSIGANVTSNNYKIKDIIEIPNGYKIAQVTPIVSGSNSGSSAVVRIIGVDQDHSDDTISINVRNISSSQHTWYLSVKVLLIKE